MRPADLLCGSGAVADTLLAWERYWIDHHAQTHGRERSTDRRPQVPA
ncbi:hypothetical protein [Alteriqipengyuania lutimaris]|nr:hypothetical protein [Alteriqipengyuania lutimaris]MBB3034035.1 hypothetical protein [Alteriqipengyuania lutimaris]